MSKETKPLSLFTSYALIFVPTSILSFLILRFYSLEFIYNDIGRMFHGSFYTSIFMTFLLTIVVTIIAYFLTRPFDRTVKRIIEGGETPTDEEKKKCLACYKSLNLMTIISIILFYAFGQVIITIMGIASGSHEYIFSRVVLILLQAFSFGFMVAVIVINGLDLKLASFRKLLQLHSLEQYKKQMNISISGSIILVFTSIFCFLAINMMAVPYGYLHQIEADAVIDILSFPVFRKGLICIIVSFVIGAVPVFITVKSLNGRIQETKENINTIALKGDLQRRIDITMLDDFGDLTTAINHLIDKLSSMIHSLKDNSGELEEKATGIFDCTSSAFEALKNMNASFNEINGNCRAQTEVIGQTHERIKILSENTQTILVHVKEQTQAVEDISASIEEMTANIASVAQTSKKAQEVSDELMDNSKAGNESLSMAVKTMNEIKNASKEVQSIVEMIKNIASQTNLLAMNAAIEAAHAGSYGLGFAVVAEEVKNLAASVSSSTSEIQKRIQGMNQIIEAGVQAMNLTENSFNAINAKVDENASLVRTISFAMEQQNIGARETMNATSEIVQSVKAVEELSNQESQGVNAVARDMEQVVDASDNTQTAVINGRQQAENLSNAIQNVDTAATSNKESVSLILKEVDQFKV